MKTKLYAKKTLSVFMAIMMLMSAWVFVAPEKASASDTMNAAEVAAANSAALNKIGTFDTNVTTITDLNWAYNGDNQDNEPNVYKNILYASDCNVATANTGSVNLKDSGAATIQWYHGTYIFLYDGVTTPQAGVMVAMYPRGSSYNIRMYSSYIAGGAGLNLAHNWYASDGRANFMWVISAPGNQNAATKDGSINSTYAWTVNSNTWFANKLQFTDSMSNDEYYRDITVTWGWKGNQKSQGTGNVYTYTAKAVNHVYVVNYVPLKNALNEALGTGTYGISTLKNNLSKYTTASVEEYVAAVKDLINAKPNNYLSSTKNDYMGYANAASAAVTRFNKAKSNLAVQNYTLKFVDYKGTVKQTYTYPYGTSINCNNLAPANSVAQIKGDDSDHQAYVWDSTNMNLTALVDDVTINEVVDKKVAHSFPANATVGDSTHSWTCSVCDYVKTQAHVKNAGTMTNADTCDEAGTMTYDCSICGKAAIETKTVDDIKGHEFTGGWVSKEEGENGTHYRECIRFDECGEYGLGTTVDNCEAHVWKITDDKSASTCNVAGHETYKCERCDATYTKTLKLAAHTTKKTEAKNVENICGGDGNVSFWSCSVCGKFWKDEALTDEVTDLTDADNDNIPDVLETKGPEHEFTGAYESVTPGANGTHKRQCKRFTQCQTYGPEEAHEYGDPVVTPASCTAPGKEVYTCKDCKQTYTETIEKAAHKMTKIDAVAAECNKAGNNEYYFCSACSKYYKDAEGKVVTTVAAEAIPALTHKWTAHHNYDTVKTPATCQTAAVYYNHCDYCKVELTGTHEYGDVDIVNGHKFNGTIQKNADGTHSYKCTVDGCTEYGNATTCIFTTVKQDVPSTCHTIGYTIYKCDSCNAEKRVEKTDYDFSNHSGGVEIIGALEAKCNSNGYTGDTHCLGCKTKIMYGEAIVADKSLHPHADMKDYAAQDSTCQAEGWKAYRYCSACGTYEIAKKTVAQKEHKFTSYTTNNNGTHTATCDTCDASVKTPAIDTQNCSGGTANCVDAAVCAICSGSYGETNAANHKEVTTIDEVKATCQVEGKTAYKKCSACGTNVTEPTAIPTIAHVWGAWLKDEGADTHTRSCTKCVDTDTLDIATETEACSGGVAYCNANAICSTCNEAYGEFAPSNHKTEAWHYADNKKDATCQAEGNTGDKLYDCCNALMEAGETIEKAAHNFSIEVSKTPATCIAEGSVVYKCSSCIEADGAEAATNTVTLAIDSKNHASEEIKIVGKVDATCETNGNTGSKYHACCYVEGASDSANRKALIEKGTVIEANGQHVFGDAVPEYMIAEIKKDENGDKTIVLKTAEPTYDEKVAYRHDDGKWYHIEICEICNEEVKTACYTYEHTYSCDNTDICYECGGLCSLKDPTKHVLEVVEGKEATATEPGIKDYYKCEDCGKCFLDEAGTKEFDPTSEEGKAQLEIPTVSAVCNWEKEASEVVEPTCVSKGYKVYKCTDEGCTKTKTVEIPATGKHTWSTEYTVTQEPTCGKNGYKAIKCTVCETVKSGSYQSVPATGKHTYVLINTTAGTSCTDPSILTYKCNVCGDTYDIASSEGVSAHTWSEWITKGGDCSTGVVQIRTCSSCQAQEQRTETTVDHDLVIKVKVEATCETDGYIDRVCKNCGFAPEREILPATSDVDGHVLNTELYKTIEKATCETAEQRQYTCTLCGEKVIEYYGEPLDHVWLLQTAEIATCERNGHSEYYKCVRCELKDELYVEYPATGHADNDGNGKCDECNGKFYEGGNEPCDCLCHNENWFMGIIYKIVNFFWKLFKTNPTCACGNAHY